MNDLDYFLELAKILQAAKAKEIDESEANFQFDKLTNKWRKVQKHEPQPLFAIIDAYEIRR